jgi:hypothetical protein
MRDGHRFLLGKLFSGVEKIIGNLSYGMNLQNMKNLEEEQ